MPNAATSDFVIPADHPCLAGHFPGNPVVPAVLLLEQVALALSAQNRRPTRIVQAKFHQPLRPAQPAELHLDATAARVGFRILAEQTLIATGTVEASA